MKNTPWRHDGALIGYVRDGAYHIDRYWDGRRHRLSTKCRTEQAAFAVFQQWEAKMAGAAPQAATPFETEVLARLERIESKVDLLLEMNATIMAHLARLKTPAKKSRPARKKSVKTRPVGSRFYEGGAD